MEYVREKVHTNGCENFWSLTKRMLNGTYVSVEPFHLFRYLDEQSYRFNNRKLTDAERFDLAVRGIVGKRLMFDQLTGKIRPRRQTIRKRRSHEDCHTASRREASGGSAIMPEAALLHCPIRGNLRVPQRAADQLTFTEEKQRIDAIRYLIQRHYPKDNFGIETTLFKIGNAGRNSFRTDFGIYDQPFDNLRGLSLPKRLDHLRVLAEIKRDNSTAEQAKATQVRAALQLVPDMDTLGVYWDDVEQRFFYRVIDGKKSSIRDAPISKIPEWGDSVGSTRLLYADLEPAKDMVRIFDEIDDAFHVYIADKMERYTLIQQLLLLKIHDENIHREGRKKQRRWTSKITACRNIHLKQCPISKSCAD